MRSLGWIGALEMLSDDVYALEKWANLLYRWTPFHLLWNNLCILVYLVIHDALEKSANLLYRWLASSPIE